MRGRKKGFKHSKETRAKIGKANKNNKLSEEHKEALRVAHTGKKHSKKTKEKMSKSAMGKNTWAKGCKKGTPSEETRMKLSLVQRGKNAPNWKGGVTKKNRLIRMGIKYRLWREKVFKRDNWTCQECGKRGGKLEAHHIKSFAHHPKLRFRINNGLTLCIPCHKLTDNYGYKEAQEIKELNNK